MSCAAFLTDALETRTWTLGGGAGEDGAGEDGAGAGGVASAIESAGGAEGAIAAGGGDAS